MSDKRTKAQLDFDLAKHGWAFSNPTMLRPTLERLRKLAQSLAPDDKRHEIVNMVEKVVIQTEKIS